MNIFNKFNVIVKEEIEGMVTAGDLPEGMDLSRVVVEPPRDVSHGDMSTNAALVLSKQAGKNPREIGQMLADKLANQNEVQDVDIAGPGFINFRLESDSWMSCLKDILTEGTHYGDCNLGKGEKINVEYVSTNPTGPIHVGHTRGAVFGDSLCNLLDKSGYKVTREYYTNDAGKQIDVLAHSAYLRYKEACGESIEIPDGLYPGDYLVPVGEALKEKYGRELMDKPEEEWLDIVRPFAVEKMMELIREDLSLLNIHHDVFTSEKEMTEAGKVQKAFDHLTDLGLVYQGVLPPPKSKNANLDDWEAEELTLLRSTDFGDDCDRPLKNSKGGWTYTAPDIAYHWDKYNRGFKSMIDIVGKDHSGWVKRITAGIKAVTNDKDVTLDVQMVSVVNLMENGQPIKMSKRAGSFKTVRDLINQVGSDVVRFIMLTRKNDQVIDFDFSKVIEQSKDNPVFYVQYAHARCCSVMRLGAEMFPDMDASIEALGSADMSLLNSAEELQLIRLMANWPRMVEAASEAREPHRIAFYLQDVAAEFHSFWNKGREDSTLRFLHEDNEELSRARLAFVKAVATVIASGLEVMGVKPVEEMHSS